MTDTLEKRFYKRRELVEYLNETLGLPITYSFLVKKKGTPKQTKIGRHVVYAHADVAEWVKQFEGEGFSDE